MSILKDIAEEDHRMEMTPMIDVTFLLLIFFLCTIEFRILEGKLAAYLPKDVGESARPAEHEGKLEISIHVVEAGQKVFARGNEEGQPWTGDSSRRFDFVGRELRYRIGPRSSDDLETIGEWMRDFREKAPETPATIDCRPGTVYGDMIPVLDRAVEAGFTDITFVGEYETARE